MSTELRQFTIPGPITENTPFRELHFWQWAQHQPRGRVAVKTYLGEVGFIVGRDKITESEYKILRYAVEAFHRCMPWMGAERKFSDVFRKSDGVTDGESFYVQGMVDRFDITQEVREALEASGWVYDVRPETTYFAIINGTVFAKYQQILGSRPLFKLAQEG